MLSYHGFDPFNVCILLLLLLLINSQIMSGLESTKATAYTEIALSFELKTLKLLCSNFFGTSSNASGSSYLVDLFNTFV